MKIIVGIDLAGVYNPALQLVSKLGFEDPNLLLVQSSPTIDTVLPPFPMDGATVDLMQSTFREAGEKALHEAQEEAKRLGLPARTLFCFGPPAEIIDECVSEAKADLVAVRTTHRGAWQSEFMGSVTRAVMLCGHVSLLVAKQELAPNKPLEVVFATDGSEFNRQCLEKFLYMRPLGVETVHVVGAWGLASDVERLLRHAFHHSPDLDAGLKAAAETAVERAVSRFEQAGYKTTFRAVQGMPDQVLHDAMNSLGVDLLVLGSHGKNWIERTLIGSTSLHQVIDEPYNILLIRP